MKTQPKERTMNRKKTDSQNIEHPAEEEIRRACEILFEPGHIVELRQLGGSGGVASGYFDDLDALCQEAAEHDGEGGGLYATINPVRPGQHTVSNVLKRSVKRTTADADIDSRKWLPIDLDPVRDSGVPATEEEVSAARERADEVEEFLTEVGWSHPVRADSGNGVHLVYPIDLPNDDEARLLVENALRALDQQFSDEIVNIDTSMSNAARIVRLPGTLNRKGKETEDRLHRRSMLVSAPASQQHVRAEDLRNLGRHYTQGALSTVSNVAEWLQSHGVEIRTEKTRSGYTLYEMEVCPFNAGHNHGEAFIMQFSNGSLFAKCHHHSCQWWAWQDLVKLLDPEKVDKLDTKRSQMDLIVDLITEEYEIIYSKDKKTFAMPQSGAKLTIPINVEVFANDLADRFWYKHGKVASLSLIHIS